MVRKKIVVLDGYTLNPGDLNWQGLADLGEVSVYDRTSPELVVARSARAHALLTNKVAITADIIRCLPGLEYIGVLATGHNVVDIAAARQAGITVTNVPAYSAASVAQLTFALVLEFCHRVQWHSDSVRSGVWTTAQDWCFWEAPLTELAGKTMGLIGLGSIGRKVAEIALAFGMNVIATSKTMTGGLPNPNFRWAPLKELMNCADVISIHCPLTSATQGLINDSRLEWVKSSALLVNTSRGAIINEHDLARALNEGRIGGAALDVLSAEPPTKDNPLLNAANCLITPHIAWATKEARERLMQAAVDNLAKFLAGTPTNVVNL